MNKPHLSENDIFLFLKELFRELTFYDGPITKDTLLVDEIGLDSLDFLEVFFKIQSKLQDLFGENHNIDINEQEIQSQLIKIILDDKTINIDPSKPELFFSQMKVEHIVTLITNQVQAQINSQKALYLLKPHLQKVLSNNITIKKTQLAHVQENSKISKTDTLWEDFHKLNIDDLQCFIQSDFVQTHSIKSYLNEVGNQITHTINMKPENLLYELEDFLIKTSLQEWLQVNKFGFLGYESRDELYKEISNAIDRYLPTLKLPTLSNSDSKEFNEKLNSYLIKHLLSFIQEHINELIVKPDTIKTLTSNYLNNQTGSNLVRFKDLDTLDGQKHVVSHYILTNLPSHVSTLVEQFRLEHTVNEVSELKNEINSDEQDDFLSRWDQLDEDDE